MPTLSVWSVRAALVYLGLGFTFGALMLSSPAIGLPVAIINLRLPHAEILLIGWMIQLAFGVAYWILPRLPGPEPRGNERVAWVSLALLNIGVVAVSLGQILRAPTGLLVGGRAAEALAVLAFASHAWGRVRSSGSH